MRTRAGWRFPPPFEGDQPQLRFEDVVDGESQRTRAEEEERLRVAATLGLPVEDGMVLVPGRTDRVRRRCRP